jgi:predicted nucleic acid-binding protein
MEDKLLVDTSAWIASFRESGNQKLKDYLAGALDLDRVLTTNIVVLELLQGCKTKKEYEAMKARLDTLPFYPVADMTWSIAYEAGFALRKKGLTVPTIDIIMCALAKENSLVLLHHDGHMKSIAPLMGVWAVDFLKG